MRRLASGEFGWIRMAVVELGLHRLFDVVDVVEHVRADLRAVVLRNVDAVNIVPLTSAIITNFT